MKVMLTQDWDEKYSQKIEAEFEDIEIVKALEDDEQQRAMEDAEVAIGFPGDLDAGILAEGPELKWVQALSAGVDKLLEQPEAEWLAENGVKLTNMSGLHRDIIAEHTMAFILSFSRRLPELFKQQQNKEWNRISLTGLKGKRLLVLGLGNIGQGIVEVANAFGMVVDGVKRNPDEGVPGVDRIYGQDQLQEAFAGVDFAVSILPLTSETEGMIGAAEFKAMPESAYFINVGRGPVVNQDELLAALEFGEIAGAGLDVFEEEPLPPESPFYKLDNVIITPHLAGSFSGYYERATDMFIENIRLYQAGKEMKRLVNYEAGY
ncbi:D-2-hydroxyacid dehydrogenase [Halanaerobiaceae bacterium Z-7014]|uniref:D-2-hydroxyacid dehydrogenase n=1 Tax=Halonatronomonas betaini TaxID=2778430 RepID=A0A931F7E0_9FIRM|nr:D-2-hydroxyacid dehydrogenase [Halonatronomonas betaini]MBF8437845.1 D-2-hydroxyacid dehydrogenase [Halonatronomonas betaini]